MTNIPRLVTSWSPPAGMLLKPSAVGAKAAGLLSLPQGWVPRFVVLTDTFVACCKDRATIEATLLALTPAERSYLDHLLGAASQGHILIRSNSATESIAERGAYETYVVRPTLPDIISGLEKMLGSAENTPIFPILQQSVEPSTTGHLSNERRVSRARPIWLLEGLTRAAIRIKARVPPNTDALMASKEAAVKSRMAEVAGWLLHQSDGYYHCEWVWDGRRVWIVQADPVAPQPTATRAAVYLSGREAQRTPFVPGASPLRHFRDVSTGRWRKLDRPIQFAELGMPTADVFVLAGEEWLRGAPGEHGALRDDLLRMCEAPVVIRSDIAASVREEEEILLPTSAPSQDVDSLLSFMETTARWFKDKGIDGANWAFLLATFVPARASAMVHASPETSTVSLDVLWGLPDGLQFFPHDTYYHNLISGQLRRKTRYKSHCNVPIREQWAIDTLASPFDWAQVLRPDEIATLSRWGKVLTDAVKREVELMALTRIEGNRGPGACLPWHYTAWSVPQYSKSVLPLLDLSRIVVVTSSRDVAQLRDRGMPQGSLGILVRPDAQSVRDKAFMRDVARVGAEKGISIYFEGSLLGHAYYVLSSEGAPVVPIDAESPVGDVTKHRKLVRDRIPAIIKRAGALARVRTVSLPEARVLLAQKLIEEAFEVWSSKDATIIEELADVLEVVDGIREQSGITAGELDRVRSRKREDRGGFSRLIYLEETVKGAFGALSTDDGALPLWEDLPGIGSLPSASTSLRAEPTANDSELVRFNLPLVPPVSKGEPAAVNKAHVGDLEVTTTYQGSRLSVVIQKARTAGPTDQLELLLGP